MAGRSIGDALNKRSFSVPVRVSKPEVMRGGGSFTAVKPKVSPKVVKRGR